MMDKIEQRFWSKVMPEPNSGCWLWLDGLVRGYGQFFLKCHPNKSRRKIVVMAHRYSYEIARGPIPTGLTLDHLCRNKCCVNPDHLEPVTLRENIQRGAAGANSRMKTHCPAGHPYTGENLKMVMRERPGGVIGVNRICRICERKTTRRYKIRKKAMATSELGILLPVPEDETKETTT